MDPGRTCCSLSRPRDLFDGALPNTCVGILLPQYWCTWCIYHEVEEPRRKAAASTSTENSPGIGPDHWSSPGYSYCSSPSSISPTMPSGCWTSPIGQPVLDRVSDHVRDIRRTTHYEQSSPLASRSSMTSSGSWTMIPDSFPNGSPESNGRSEPFVSSSLSSGSSSGSHSHPVVTAQKLCPHCNKPCSNTGNLNKHIREKHEKPGYPCRLCGLSLPRADTLRKHECEEHGMTQSVKS